VGIELPFGWTLHIEKGKIWIDDENRVLAKIAEETSRKIEGTKK